MDPIIQTAVDTIQKQLNALVMYVNRTVSAGGSTGTLAVDSVAPEAAVDVNGMLYGFRNFGGYRVDPKVAGGSSATVTLPSGRVVSVPRPDKGEMFGGYLTRVSDQCDGDPSTVAMFIVLGGLDPGQPDNWPAAAEQWYQVIMKQASPRTTTTQWQDSQSQLAAKQ